jgi:hypothetical protein
VIATYAQARPSSNSIFERHVVCWWLGPVSPVLTHGATMGAVANLPSRAGGIVSPRVHSGDSFSPLA